MKHVLFILLLCVGVFAMSYSMDQNMNQDLTNEDRMLYGFVAREGKKLGKKYGMSQVGIGGGATKEGIWLMSLDFQRYGSPLNEEEARQLIISCLHDYLEAVNNDEKLRPFLKVYPFKPENIKIGIFCYGVDRRDLFYPHLSVVKASEGKIGYYTEEQSNPAGYKTKKYESYAETIAILQKGQSLENNS